MANYIATLFNSAVDAANTAAEIAGDYNQKQATLSTQTKNIQLQNDINAELMRIRQSSDFENWNTNINNFFTRVKSGMANKDSPYYCQNNLQAEMFTKILEQNQVNVSDQVGKMVQQRQMEKSIVDVQNSKTMLAQMTSGQEYIDQANELDRGLYESGAISLEQYQQQKDLNYAKAYEDMRIKTFDASLNDALAQNKSFEAFYADVKSVMPELKATDTSGLEKVVDKTSMDSSIEKICRQNYNARLSDIQQGNANALSAIVQEMRQKNTAEDKVNVARKGQLAMNRMQGLKLSESDRLQYSAIFELALGGDSLKGSGSGSGSKSPTETYESLIKASPDTALQLWLDGKNGNVYDVTQTVSNALTEQWFTKSFKENYDKDTAEREETFALQYQGRTSSDTLTDAVTKKVLEKFPTAKNYMDNNFKNLITDMQKNPKEYGSATAGELANFMLDTLYSADSNYTDEDFMTAFKQHVNDCYVERVKYVELDKKGNLEKKFNASKEGDIAKAARLASEKDYVYTFNGNEVWAPGKKEALEAEGGIVDVLKTAVAGTLDIPAEDRGKVGFQYVQTKDDMTSQPIITYKNQAYEVIPNDDDKGFKLREVHTGEIIEGKLSGKAKAERTEAKAQAKAETKTAHNATYSLEEKRINDTNTAITESKEMPKAMAGAGAVKATEWETGDQTTRQIYLQDTVNKIDKEAVKIDKLKKKGKDAAKEQDDFYEKYGIRYYDWSQTSEKTARYNLILNS